VLMKKSLMMLGLYLDIQEVLSHDVGALVDGLPRPVEDSSEHVFGHRRAEDVAGELAGRLLGVDAGSSLEDLNNGLRSGHLKNLSSPVAAVGQLQVDDFGKFWKLDIIQDDQGAVDTGHCSVGDPGLSDVVSEMVQN